MSPAVLLLLPPRSYLTWPPSLESMPIACSRQGTCLLTVSSGKSSGSPSSVSNSCCDCILEPTEVIEPENAGAGLERWARSALNSQN